MTCTPTTSVTFRTTLEATGGSNVGIVVPEDVVLGFGRGKRVPVVVTVDGGHSYRTTVASMGGRFLVSFNAATRAVPPALAEALAAHPPAAAAWAALSHGCRRAHAESVAGAHAPETAARRVEKVLAALT